MWQTNGSGRRNITATDVAASAYLGITDAITNGHLEISSITYQVITAESGAYIDFKAEDGTDLIARIHLDTAGNPVTIFWDAPYVFPDNKRLRVTYVGTTGVARISGGMYFSTSPSSK